MAESDSRDRISVLISFRGNLNYFLKEAHRRQPVRCMVDRKTSVKDVIEARGVPHPEVDLILVEGEPVDFSFLLETESELDVYPVSTQHPPSSRLQERGICSFVADGHLGKLTRDLRLLGIDVAYQNDVDDRDLLAVMQRENRVLLTRDRRLLMHAVVKNGYFPRSQRPLEQTVEIIHRFELEASILPFSRCLRCNGVLRPAKKETVIDQLQPLTRLYYDEFSQCPICGQTYWRGSHLLKLENRVKTIRNAVAVS
jgi:uncharacterized protein with PIN domain